MALALEHGPAQAVTVQWRVLLEDLLHEAETLEIAATALTLDWAPTPSRSSGCLYPVDQPLSLHFRPALNEEPQMLAGPSDSEGVIGGLDVATRLCWMITWYLMTQRASPTG
ncbi:hypothetical protein ACGFNU_44350 [Spirillospora sp. NPDC048911]|uniref:hypothetical protein n=1 Tax=Spirillospora sp. NPDC048911 TaxID=3364527 RepID=UPI0037170761